MGQICHSTSVVRSIRKIGIVSQVINIAHVFFPLFDIQK